MANDIKKVLVVGGAGYIGGAVTDELAKKGIPFAVFDNLLYEYQYQKPLEFIFGDIREKEKLAKILPNYSHVIWLAAIVGDAACNINPELTVQVNQEPVEWLSKNYQGRIIFLSTCSVYGQNNSEVNENSSLNPLSLYAKTKMQAEKLLEGKNSLILRLGTVFGVSDTYSRVRMDLVVNYMTARALLQGNLSIFGGGQWRPLVHVNDVAKIIVDNLEKDFRGTYNIASFNYQIKDLGEEIGKITGCKVSYTEKNFEDSRNYHVNTKKAQLAGILDLRNVTPVEYGVKQISDLINSRRLKYTENDIYFNERHIANLHKNGQFK